MTPFLFLALWPLNYHDTRGRERQRSHDLIKVSLARRNRAKTQKPSTLFLSLVLHESKPCRIGNMMLTDITSLINSPLPLKNQKNNINLRFCPNAKEERQVINKKANKNQPSTHTTIKYKINQNVIIEDILCLYVSDVLRPQFPYFAKQKGIIKRFKMETLF